VNLPTRLIEEVGAAMFDYKIKLTDAEDHSYATMKDLQKTELMESEICCVRVVIGGKFEKTNEVQGCDEKR
jgi:hypothetical protein